jgi:H+/Cl- antiporter ClcA
MSSTSLQCLCFLAPHIFLAFSSAIYGLALPSGLFVPVIFNWCSLWPPGGRHVDWVAVNFRSWPFAVLGSATLLGRSMRMTVSVCAIVLEAWNCSDPLAPFFVYPCLSFLNIGVSVCTDLNWKS